MLCCVPQLSCRRSILQPCCSQILFGVRVCQCAHVACSMCVLLLCTYIPVYVPKCVYSCALCTACLHMLVASIYICWRAAQHHVSPAIAHSPPLPLRPGAVLHNDSEGRAVWERLNLEHIRRSGHSLTLSIVFLPSCVLRLCLLNFSFKKFMHSPQFQWHYVRGHIT